MNNKLNVKLIVKFTVPKWRLKDRYSVTLSRSIKELGTIPTVYCEDKSNAFNLRMIYHQILTISLYENFRDKSSCFLDINATVPSSSSAQRTSAI